jgi:hypothetical protein
MNGALTVFTSIRPSTLGKKYAIDESGKISVEVAGNLLEGTYEVCHFHDTYSLSAILTSINTNQAISASLPRDGSSKGSIVNSARAIGEKSLARTKEHFHFADKPGLMILDYDPPKNRDPQSKDELWESLVRLCPPLASTGVVWWCSGSSFIAGPKGELQGLRGQRFYVLVQDASDIERAGRVISDLCWRNNLGRIDISKSGSMLKRTLFDEAMHQAARLDFIGGAVCTPPLVQDRGVPECIGGNNWLDTRTALPSQTDRREIERIQKAASNAAASIARETREAWLEAKVAEQSPVVQRNERITASNAQRKVRRIYEAAVAGILHGGFSIPMADGTNVSVSDVLDNWQKYDGRKTFDPLEPEHRNYESCGKLFLSGGTPNIYSFAHGGVTYRLMRQPQRIVNAKGRQSAVADILAEALSSQGDIFFTTGTDLVHALPGRLQLLDKAALQYLLGHRVYLVTTKNGAEQLINIPAELVSLTQAALGQRPSQSPPVLKSVTSLPYATADRQLYLEPGYSSVTGIFNIMQQRIESLPGTVSEAACIEALRVIWSPWKNYVWSTPADRAGMLAAIFTAVLRPAMEIAPGVFFDAPVQGS